MNQYPNFKAGNIPSYRQPTPYKRPIRANALVIGFGLLALIMTPYLLTRILNLTSPLWIDIYNSNLDIARQIESILYFVFSFTIAIVVMVSLLKIPPKVAFPLKSPSLDVTIGSIGISRGAILFGSIISSLVYNALISISGYAPVSPDYSSPRGLTANILHFISIAILPAFLEEFLFRGVIMQSLRRFGDSFALIISSVLFGLLHGNFVQAPYTTLMGLVMGYFVLYSGSLWPAIIIHFINNGISVVKDWIKLTTTAQQDTQIYYFTLAAALLISLASLIFLKKRLGSVFYIPPSKYPLTEKEKYIAFISSSLIIILFIISAYLFIVNLKPYDPIPSMEALYALR